jgi:UDP-N-acetylmuramoyl-tripeptide--D-alanyl-D-alanine ligase
LLTPTVIAITGSVGKTSTKEVAASVLSRRFRTLKNKRSFNSEVTVPTTLLQLTPSHQVAVVEVGMWAPGEIRFLAGLARPSIGLVTNVGPSHLERMGSIEAIARAKTELVEALPASGVAILNGDDAWVAPMAAASPARVVQYGLGEQADVRASHVECYGLGGIRFQVHYAGDSHTVQVALPGYHNVYNALAAISIGLVMEMSWHEIVDGLHDVTEALRLNVIPVETAAMSYTVIDDSYNASPVSVLAALDLLAQCGSQQHRLAVMGDMLELGSFEQEGHSMVGQRAADVVHRLVCVGSRARWIADAAQQSGMATDCIHLVDHAAQAVSVVRELVQAGDYVLVKGSRAVGLEQVVDALTTIPGEESSLSSLSSREALWSY